MKRKLFLWIVSGLVLCSVSVIAIDKWIKEEKEGENEEYEEGEEENVEIIFFSSKGSYKGYNLNINCIG
jgi:hypothetical protein